MSCKSARSLCCFAKNTQHTKEQAKSHILDTQPHHPPPPIYTPPPPEHTGLRSHTQTLGAGRLCCLPSVCVCTRWRGGCFLFRQLIDSQMSGWASRRVAAEPGASNEYGRVSRLPYLGHPVNAKELHIKIQIIKLVLLIFLNSNKKKRTINWVRYRPICSNML